MGGLNLRELLEKHSCKDAMSVSLSKLPPELIAYILSYLPGKDIANAAKACRTLYEASQIEQIWQARCIREFGIFHRTLPTCMQLYTRILYKYGSLIGLWHLDASYYGGLVQVKFEEGKIFGIEWRPPIDPHLDEPLRRRDMFSIEPEANGAVKLYCLKGYSGPHNYEINMRNNDGFYSKCCEKHRHPEGKEREFIEYVRDETSHLAHISRPQHHELLVMKFIVMKQYENSFEYRRLNLPPPQADAPIQPGLFKGTYGAHGLEIVLLTYEDSGNGAKVIKITGDPNIPAGRVTFRVDLRNILWLNEEDQLTMSKVSEARPQSPSKVAQSGVIIEIPSVEGNQAAPSSSSQQRNGRANRQQPFCVPADCMERMANPPKYCRARYQGFGQIAGHGYTNPSYSPGHWIVFDENLFGFLWLELRSLSLYHRVQEDLT